MLITIFVILVALVAIVLTSPLRLKFEFSDDAEFAALAFLFGTVSFDLPKRHLEIRLAGFRIKKIKTGKKAKAAKAKKVSIEKPKARKRRFKIPKLKFVYARWALQLLRKIHIRYLNLNIAGGFEDPYHTGNAAAIYWTAKGISPRFMSHITFSPEFSSNCLTFNGKGLITIKMYYIVRLILRLLTDIVGTKIRRFFILRTKGVSYG